MGIELFERAVSGGGQLLKAELRPLGGRTDQLAALLLTFDLGRVGIGVDPVTSSLTVDYLESADRAAPGLQDASEEEPWWRVLGAPIARVWLAGPEHPGAVCLQFRADEQSPRIITLQPKGGSVEVRLENAP